MMGVTVRRMAARTPRVLVLISFLVILCISGFTGCSGKGEEKSLERQAGTSLGGGKVAIIGLDGASWNVLMPLVKAGKTPNIKKLMDNGTWGNLRSEEPTQSPVIWTTIVTGKSREEHGITDFAIKVPGEYDSIPATSNIRKTKTLWDIFSDEEKSTGFLNWWASWPAEKVNGFDVTNYMFFLPVLEDKTGSVDKTKHLTYPEKLAGEIAELRKPDRTEYAGELRKIFGSSEVQEGFTARGSTRPMDTTSKEYEQGIIKHFLQSQVEIEMGLTGIAVDLYSKYRPVLFGLYYEGIDVASHEWWKFMQPHTDRGDFDVSEDEINSFGKVLPGYYEFTDRQIGRILDVLDEDTTVIVVSDHGFQAKDPRDVANIFKLNHLFAKLGYLTYEDEAKEDIDYSRTRLVDFAHSEFWGRERKLYVNLKGREKTGIVEPGREYKSFIKEVNNTLGSLKTETGKPLFLEIKDSGAGAADGKNTGPDLTVRINFGISPEEKVLIGGSKYPIKDFFLPRPASGIHAIDGIFIISGPNTKKNHEISGATIYDITPTVLYIADLPVAKDMSGKVLEDAFNGGTLSNRPVKFIPTYERGAGEGPSAAKESAVDEQYKERLKSLGYIQ